MTNQQAPEIYTLHTVPNKGERPWSGIYAVRADAEHDAKVLRGATGRDWSVVRLVVADTATTPTGPVARYKISCATDDWGMRSSTPSGIPDHAGAWVRYEDHAAALCRLHTENEALRAQQDDAYDHGPQAETVEEAARDVGKWLNERPNRPLDLRHVAMLTHHAKRTAHVQNPAEIEHVAGDVSKNGAELNVSTQQPAAPQGVAYADAHGAIMGAAYDFRDAHISGSPNQKRSAHAALESAVTHALRAQQPAPAGAARSAEELARDLKKAIETATELREQLTLMEEHARGEVWRWQGDDADDLATMGNRMGVLIYASDLRNLIATTPQPAPATQQAGEVRRAELVPGVMHCAKCKFQLNRVTLCVSDGNAYAGSNKTEPCPNGCGPLWPVTWEQEAKNCWKALEEMHERLMAAAAPQPSPAPQADSQPAMTPETVYAAIAHGDEEHRAWLLSALRAVWCGEAVPPVASPIANAAAESQPAPVLGYPPLPRVGAIGYASVVDIQSYAKTLTIGPHLPGVRDIALWTTDQMRAYVDADRAARAPADSVLEDAARWQWLADYLIGERTDLDEGIVACATIDALRQFADAARKQGGA